MLANQGVVFCTHKTLTFASIDQFSFLRYFSHRANGVWSWAVLERSTWPGVSLHQRPLVLLLPPYVIINDAKCNHRKRHQYAVIHILSRYWRQRRPETPKQNKEDVDARVDVVDHAEDPG